MNMETWVYMGQPYKAGNSMNLDLLVIIIRIIFDTFNSLHQLLHEGL